MKKLREVTTRYSLADLVEAVGKAWKEEDVDDAQVVDGATSPEAKPEGEREFVKLHKTSKAPIRTGTRPEVFTASNIKKDTSRAGRDPLPGFPPEVRPESLEEQETHALSKGENPWKVWKGLGADKPSWTEFKGLQSKETIGAKSSRHLPVGHEIKLPGGGSPKAQEFQKTEAPTPAKVQTPDTQGAAGAPQPSKSPTAPQWSPTAKPFTMTPVTPEMKAKQIQSPINKEPMNRVPGTTPPPSAMDRVKAVTGRATPPAATASASPAPSSTQATGQAAPTPSGPSASSSVNLTGAAKVAGAVGRAMTGQGLSVGQEIGKNFPSVTSAISGAAKSLVPGQGVSVGMKLGQKFRNWLGKEETEQLMEHRAAILSSLIRGLEPPLDEAAGVAKLVSKKVDPLIKRPKFDARGNLVLTQHAKQNITQGKKSRKLSGKTYDPAKQKRFGEAKEEELDEARDREMDVFTGFRSDKGKIKGSPTGRNSKTRQAREKAGPNFRPKSAKERYASNRRRAEMSRKHPELSEDSLDEWGLVPKGDARKIREKKETVLVSPKGYKGGGKVQRIPKSQYDPKKHSLAEEQLDEKNWIQGAIKKPGALTASAKRAGQSVGEFAREHKHSSGKVGQRARLALTLKGLNKEETEQIDELKKDTLARYTKSAATDLKYQSMEYGHDPLAKRARIASRKITNREKGIGQAAERLGGTYETGKPRKYMVPGDESGKTYSAKKKKLYHGEETQLDEGGPTKKHFQMAADAIRAIPDENKRKEHAAAHADLYSKQNPRFNREKFYQAAGLKKHQYGPNEETQLDEVITKSTPVGDVIHDFVHSKNKVFKGDSKKQRIKRALGAYYGKQRGE